jgi:hypothetical protein
MVALVRNESSEQLRKVHFRGISSVGSTECSRPISKNPKAAEGRPVKELAEDKCTFT